MAFDYKKKSIIEIRKKNNDSLNEIKRIIYDNEINALLLPLLSIMPFYTFLEEKQMGLWGISPVIYKKKEVLAIKTVLTVWLTVFENYNFNSSREILFSFFEDSYIRSNFKVVHKELTAILSIIDFYLESSDVNDFVIDYTLIDNYQ